MIVDPVFLYLTDETMFVHGLPSLTSVLRLYYVKIELESTYRAMGYVLVKDVSQPYYPDPSKISIFCSDLSDSEEMVYSTVDRK